ncbi:nuclear transport factor 2 family protein [Mycobacterium sp. 2YAF39]|uniref:nuclear transport factor 2 family protein n=1 Tax=Mycobacterium sp. 2YAF39 TaxID=3233033 RepID=UPI003F9A9314
MTAPEQIAQTVRTYVDGLGRLRPEELVALYADTGFVEDPVGTEPHRGHDALLAFYAGTAAVRMETELITLKVVPGQAAFHFRMKVFIDPQDPLIIAPIEIMTFDDDGKITSMKAYWSPDDSN